MPVLDYPTPVEQVLELDAKGSDDVVHRNVLVRHLNVQPTRMILHRELERLVPLRIQSRLDYFCPLRGWQVRKERGASVWVDYVYEKIERWRVLYQ